MYKKKECNKIEEEFVSPRLLVHIVEGAAVACSTYPGQIFDAKHSLIFGFYTALSRDVSMSNSVLSTVLILIRQFMQKQKIQQGNN